MGGSVQLPSALVSEVVAELRASAPSLAARIDAAVTRSRKRRRRIDWSRATPLWGYANDEQIAALMQCSRAAVESHRRRNGIESGQRCGLIELALSRRLAGFRVPDVVAAFDVDEYVAQTLVNGVSSADGVKGVSDEG